MACLAFELSLSANQVYVDLSFLQMIFAVIVNKICQALKKCPCPPRGVHAWTKENPKRSTNDSELAGQSMGFHEILRLPPNHCQRCTSLLTVHILFFSNFLLLLMCMIYTFHVNQRFTDI